MAVHAIRRLVVLFPKLLGVFVRKLGDLVTECFFHCAVKPPPRRWPNLWFGVCSVQNIVQNLVAAVAGDTAEVYGVEDLAIELALVLCELEGKASLQVCDMHGPFRQGQEILLRKCDEKLREAAFGQKVGAVVELFERFFQSGFLLQAVVQEQ